MDFQWISELTVGIKVKSVEIFSYNKLKIYIAVR